MGEVKIRKIAVMDHYLTSELKELIGDTAASLGYFVDYFPTAADVLPVIDDYEIFFGNDAVPVLQVAQNLKWFACAFAGIDPYLSGDVWANPNCLFTNSAGAYGVTISEHVLMVLLMLLRKMPGCQKRMENRVWQRDTSIRSIYGLRVTVVGMGDVGTEIARRLKAMGALVRGVRRNVKRRSDPAFDAVYAVDEMDSLLSDTDALILCVPSTGETAGLLSRTRIARLPEGAYVVNVGRGTAIDQEALIDALYSGHLAGAALDVMMPEPLPPEHPLWDAPNVILTPHCSGDLALPYTKRRVVEMFLENLKRYDAGEPLLYTPDRLRGY